MTTQNDDNTQQAGSVQREENMKPGIGPLCAKAWPETKRQVFEILASARRGLEFREYEHAEKLLLEAASIARRLAQGAATPARNA